MGKFFHGWRRKIGVVTLLMACMFAVGWVTSLSGRLPSERGVSIEIELWESRIDVVFNQIEFVESDPHNLIGTWEFRRIPIPYWSIVIPLTLLSAFLLLSKPRPRKRAAVINPASDATA